MGKKDWSPKAPDLIPFREGNEILPAKGKYPEDALYVDSVAADRKSFKAAPLHGGFVYTFDLAAVGKYGFRFVQPDEMESKWRKGLFSLDSPPYPGWTDGHLWNGWATPAFEKKVAERILKDFSKVYRDYNDLDHMVWWKYDEESDSFIYEEIKGEELMVIKGFKIHAGGKTRTVYPIGDGWTWDEEDQKEKEE
jgi:hypothetical protein